MNIHKNEYTDIYIYIYIYIHMYNWVLCLRINDVEEGNGGRGETGDNSTEHVRFIRAR
jgi:hypothetical protein